MLLEDTFQPTGTFWFFSIVTLFGIAWVWFLLPETAGRTLEEPNGLFDVRCCDKDLRADSKNRRNLSPKCFDNFVQTGRVSVDVSTIANQPAPDKVRPPISRVCDWPIASAGAVESSHSPAEVPSVSLAISTTATSRKKRSIVETRLFLFQIHPLMP